MTTSRAVKTYPFAIETAPAGSRRQRPLALSLLTKASDCLNSSFFCLQT